MAIAAIQSWLRNGCKYQEGLILCLELSDNDALKDILQEGNNDFNRRQLFKELQRLNEQSPDPVITSTNSVPPGDFKTISQPQIKKWESENFTSDVNAMAVRAGELTRKINFLRSRLEVIPTREERLEAALSIQSMAKERQKLYTNIDYYNEHKKLPEAEPEIKKNRIDIDSMSQVELLRHYKNLAPRISKAIKKGDTLKAQELELERVKVKSKLEA